MDAAGRRSLPGRHGPRLGQSPKRDSTPIIRVVGALPTCPGEGMQRAGTIAGSPREAVRFRTAPEWLRRSGSRRGSREATRRSDEEPPGSVRRTRYRQRSGRPCLAQVSQGQKSAAEPGNQQIIPVSVRSAEGLTPMPETACASATTQSAQIGRVKRPLGMIPA